MKNTLPKNCYIYRASSILSKNLLLLILSLPIYANQSNHYLTEDLSKVLTPSALAELNQCLDWFEDRKLTKIESGITRPVDIQISGYAICWDGEFGGHLPESIKQAIAKLDKENDLVLAVRSFGGNTETALNLAEQLVDFNTQVVVVDFCASSCANYLLTPANSRIVLADSLVLFHGGVNLDLLEDVEAQLSSQVPALPAEQLYANFFHIRQNFLQQIRRQEQLLEIKRVDKHLFRWMALYPKMSASTQKKHCPSNSRMFVYSPETLASFKINYAHYAGPQSQAELDQQLARWNIPGTMCYWQ